MSEHPPSLTPHEGLDETLDVSPVTESTSTAPTSSGSVSREYEQTGAIEDPSGADEATVDFSVSSSGSAWGTGGSSMSSIASVSGTGGSGSLRDPSASGTSGAVRSAGAMDGPPEIAGYDVIGWVGQGGVGKVWRAVQRSTKRHVALKVLAPSALGSRKALMRFDREVELAARLGHPSIVRVFDRGVDRGVCYYAMELVDGVHLDEYIREHQLSHRDTLALVRTVCQAVQHAHQRGVIHRDLKPSNILVTGEGTPCIVDFGLAKALEPDESSPEVTVEGGVSGTPAYMSPEQAQGHVAKIDTRSDVFSLGVILYRLLTGTPPHDLTGTPYEIQKRVAETEIRPPREVCPAIDRELEVLLLKALALDPEERYASAGQLAEDLDNYLSGEPLLARRPTVLYVLRKRVRKHRVAFGVTGAVAAALVLFATYTHVRVTQERDRAVLAERQAATERDNALAAHRKTLAVSSVLRNMLWAANPSWAPGREVTVRDVLDRAADRVDTELADQPDVRAEIRDTLGRTYLSLGRYGEAARQLREVLEHRRRTLGEHHRLTLQTANNLALTLAETGSYDEAEALYRDLLTVYRDRLGDENPETLAILGNLASLLYDLGRYADAEHLNRGLRESQTKVLGADDPRTLLTQNNLALALCELGRANEARPLFEDALARAREHLGTSHPNTLTIWGNLGRAMALQNQHADAAKLLAAVARTKEQVLGLEHPDTLLSLTDWARCLVHLGQYPLAGTLLQRALDTQRRVLPPEHRHTLRTLADLATVHAAQHRFPDARTCLQEVHQAFLRRLGPDHPDVARIEANLGNVLLAVGEYGEARPLLEHALTVQTARSGRTHPVTLATMRALVLVLEQAGEENGARQLRAELQQVGAELQDGASPLPAEQPGQRNDGTGKENET